MANSEEILLLKSKEDDNNNKESSVSSRITWRVLAQEVKRIGCIAGPMVAVTLSQNLLLVLSLMMVGHLSELALSSTALAISLSAVTGFSVIQGMASALETLCGQAYGAHQYRKVRIQIYTAMFSLILVCIPLSILWICVEKILLFMGQDPQISYEAGQSLSLEWSFELLVLLSGLLPNPQLETSVLSVCLNTISTFYALPYGIAAGGSTRISNELGAGNSQAARIVVLTSVLITATETVIVSSTLFASRNVFGYIFSNEKEVVNYVKTMAPLVCFAVIMDSIQGVLSGVARGCGWQHIAAYINLGAFYLCGILVAASLAFWMHLNGKGLWIGIQIGAFLQTTMLAVVTSRTNYEEEALKARERIFHERSSLTNGLLA